MARLPRVDKKSLNARFKFAEDSFAGAAGGWDSQLRAATGIEDGERYLLRLFKKTGTPLDGDLGRLVARGLRRIRRVLSSRRARDLLVEVREVVEDRDELGILMLDPGSPVAGTPRAFRARHGLLLAGGARATFWRNIARVAEGLALCHDAGIVHGAVSEHAIFSHGDDRQDYRLGGYETCVHIGDADLGQSGQLLRPSGAISFRQDWIDLGRTAAAILGVSGDGGPSLLSIERRMLDRLSDPPRFQLFDVIFRWFRGHPWHVLELEVSDGSAGDEADQAVIHGGVQASGGRAGASGQPVRWCRGGGTGSARDGAAQMGSAVRWSCGSIRAWAASPGNSPSAPGGVGRSCGRERPAAA